MLRANMDDRKIFYDHTPGFVSTTPRQEVAILNAVKRTEERKEQRDEDMLKHPLKNKWTLWYLENDPSVSWEDMQLEIASFDTVEDFWTLYNYIKAPSEIKIGCDYSLFKSGVRPMWEDPANHKGGRWLITLNRNSKTYMDSLWLDCLLCLIGEAFERSDHFCGAVVNVRGSANKISIWTADGSNNEAVLDIGHTLKDVLRLDGQTILYQLHKDVMRKQGSFIKSIHIL